MKENNTQLQLLAAVMLSSSLPFFKLPEAIGGRL
jgi:hypothetical protein